MERCNKATVYSLPCQQVVLGDVKVCVCVCVVVVYVLARVSK